MQLASMGSHALFSDDRVYRYALWRTWDPTKPGVLFVGLNPSTADETEDDPTIRRCIRFARDWGYGGITMANVFAYRATEPSDLPIWHTKRIPCKDLSEAIGPENDAQLRALAESAGIVVACWGSNMLDFREREREVIDLIGPRIHCLGYTKAGCLPRHPSRIAANTPLCLFTGGGT